MMLPSCPELQAPRAATARAYNDVSQTSAGLTDVMRDAIQALAACLDPGQLLSDADLRFL
jgi:hypothetical protein